MNSDAARFRRTAFGPEAYGAVVAGLLFQVSVVIGWLPLGFGAYFVPAIVGLPMLVVRGFCRRIGTGLMASLLTVPYAVMGIAAMAALRTLF